MVGLGVADFGAAFRLQLGDVPLHTPPPPQPGSAAPAAALGRAVWAAVLGPLDCSRAGCLGGATREVDEALVRRAAGRGCRLVVVEQATAERWICARTATCPI
jgi:hypothetical protein